MREAIAVGRLSEVGLEPEAKTVLCPPVVRCILAASAERNRGHVLLSVKEKYI